MAPGLRRDDTVCWKSPVLVAEVLAALVFTLRIISSGVELGLGDDELLGFGAVSKVSGQNVEGRTGHVRGQFNRGIGFTGGDGGEDIRNGVDRDDEDIGARLEASVLDGLDGANSHVI